MKARKLQMQDRIIIFILIIAVMNGCLFINSRADTTTASKLKSTNGAIITVNNGIKIDASDFYMLADELDKKQNDSTAVKYDGSNAVGSSVQPIYISSTGQASAITGTIENDISGTAAKATELVTARYIDGVSFKGTSDVSHYAECSTAAATVAKTASITGYKLAKGSVVYIKFSYGNSASDPTLNISSTGAKKITSVNGTAPMNWKNNDVVTMVYDGTNYVMLPSMGVADNFQNQIDELNNSLGGVKFGKDGDGNVGYYGADGSLIPFNTLKLDTFKTLGKINGNTKITVNDLKVGASYLVICYAYQVKYIEAIDNFTNANVINKKMLMNVGKDEGGWNKLFNFYIITPTSTSVTISCPVTCYNTYGILDL